MICIRAFASAHHTAMIVQLNIHLYDFSRIPSNNTTIRYILCHNRICSHDYMISNFQTGVNHCTPSNINMMANPCFHILVLFIPVMIMCQNQCVLRDSNKISNMNSFWINPVNFCLPINTTFFS